MNSDFSHTQKENLGHINEPGFCFYEFSRRAELVGSGLERFDEVELFGFAFAADERIADETGLTGRHFVPCVQTCVGTEACGRGVDPAIDER